MMNPELSQRQKKPVWRLSHTLSNAELVSGLTEVENELFVLCGRDRNQIEVYSTEDFSLLRRISVTDLGYARDMTSCARNRCLYIADSKNECIHRISLLNGSVVRWPVGDSPAGLSLTAGNDLLVTCSSLQKLKLFSVHDSLPCDEPVRCQEISLPAGIDSPLHAVQLDVNEFIVSHGVGDNAAHRVCLIGLDGRIMKTYGGCRQKLDGASHLAVDESKLVYVADFRNHRVLLLDACLNYVCDALTINAGLEWPYRLCLSADGQRLYVAECYFDGKVSVFEREVEHN